MILFNFYELEIDSGRDPIGIIILAYALYKGYNNTIGNKYYLAKVLNIPYIPSRLYTNKYLFRHYRDDQIYSNYKCREPMSYFTSASFLTSNQHISHKVTYLKLLSLRPLTDKNNYIPSSYLKEEIYNPFIQIHNDKIHFTT